MGWYGGCLSTPPKAGAEIFTNTPKLRKHRKMILELLLSNHCRDLYICAKNGNCRLQGTCFKIGITKVRLKIQQQNRILMIHHFAL